MHPFSTLKTSKHNFLKVNILFNHYGNSEVTNENEIAGSAFYCVRDVRNVGTKL